MEVARQTVESGKVVKCRKEGCGRLIYPGMTYVIVKGKELGPEGEKGVLMCEECFSNLGWELAQPIR